MVLSRRWLKDYVNLDDISDKKFCDEMTLSGSKVEEFKKEGSELENIVVGQIKSLERQDRKSTRLNSSHVKRYRMPSSA